MIPAQIQRRLAVLEQRHRAANVKRRSKAERDRVVAEALADPDMVREVSARLLGCDPKDPQHIRESAILSAALRADT
ncbi:hypothetical protein [Enterovirga sp. CN4-39]|uniref:hypothetical protein n=1 Tax=Enterovirga sp. CN4-39 TaxID=3400910 RepID=UPI003C0141FE